mmetsp:Transcript_23973/g.58755  ORF Transcript_23973/g.58755 Transcript_23973/m.58755 type:complete len:252 (-) Transcript_23973:251-1006(-)
MPLRPMMILSRCACCLVRVNTMVLVTKVRFTTASRCASFMAAAPGRSRSTSSVSVPGVVPSWSALRRAGFFMENSARSSTPLVSVALNNMVCRRLGQCRTISRISSKKPISNNRSASSSTRLARSSSPTLCVLRTWSISRPGVATTTSGLVRSAAACTLADKPPTTKAARMVVNCARRSVIWCTCTASSRVGTSTSTCVAATGRGPRCSMRSRHGSMNAAVLPDPVTARPQMSRPVRARGTTAAWIGVGAL